MAPSLAPSDFGIFHRQLTQILILAFAAMSVASVVAGLILWCLLNTLGAPWPFLPSFLTGVINSATDPVAVVALLKELGTAKTLGTLIEGESLLNDGSAVVLYIFVKNAIGYDHATAPPPWMVEGNIGFEFLRVVANMLFFGILLGLLGGVVTRAFLRFVYNDKLIEASILISLSFLTFWLGELATGASAVIAVVVMGLYINRHKSCISPEVLHFLHEFYDMIAHALNTLIFAIAGLKMGTFVGDQSFELLGVQGSSGVVGIWGIVRTASRCPRIARTPCSSRAHPLARALAPCRRSSRCSSLGA